MADARSTLPKSLVPVKNDRSRTLFPTFMFTKKFQCFCGRQFTICTELHECSLLEMLRERAFLINSAASHVKFDSHCERTAFVTTSIFCMYADKTLMRPYVSFHVYIAAPFEFSKCSVHQIQGSFLLLNFNNIDVKL